MERKSWGFEDDVEASTEIPNRLSSPVVGETAVPCQSDDEGISYEYIFPQNFHFIEDIIKYQFRLENRKATIPGELYAGCVHFIACLYLLIVIPQQLTSAGFAAAPSGVITAACCGIGSIMGGLFSNLPFVFAPNTAVSIFYALFVKTHLPGQTEDASTALIISGIILLLFGYRPFAYMLTILIPSCIQFSVAIGIGLITALAGCTSINLIISGTGSQLDELANLFSPDFFISTAGTVIIAMSLHYHFRGGFCVAIIFCAIIGWAITEFPAVVVDVPTAPPLNVFSPRRAYSSNMILLIFDLIFLYIITLNGLARSFATLAGITKSDGGVPRARWVYIICSFMTIFSGLFGGTPILMSSESGAGIKAGAKTGLSAVLCGIFFCISTFFVPLFESVPPSATAPVLITIGVILFTNTKYVDWSVYRESFPAFFVLFFIPFSYSVLKGSLMGWILYLIMSIFTGDLYTNTFEVLTFVLALFRKPMKSTEDFQQDDCDKSIDPAKESFATAAARIIRDIRNLDWGIAFRSIIGEALNFDDNYILDDESTRSSMGAGNRSSNARLSFRRSAARKRWSAFRRRHDMVLESHGVRTFAEDDVPPHRDFLSQGSTAFYRGNKQKMSSWSRSKENNFSDKLNPKNTITVHNVISTVQEGKSPRTASVEFGAAEK